MHVGKRVRAWREQRDLSRRELGEMIGVTGNAVTQWELGNRDPRTEHLRTLTDALGISMSEFWGVLPGQKAG